VLSLTLDKGARKPRSLAGEGIAHKETRFLKYGMFVAQDGRIGRARTDFREREIFVSTKSRKDSIATAGKSNRNISFKQLQGTGKQRQKRTEEGGNVSVGSVVYGATGC